MMFTHLSLVTLLLSYTSLYAYEITMDKPSLIPQKKVQKKHLFKKDAVKKVVVDIDAGLMWQDDIASKTVKKGLVDAKTYCYKLTLASFTNWRLPSIEELETIADITLQAPAINKEFKNVKSDFYMSSSPKLSDIDTISYMDFNNGHKYDGSRRGHGYVRCVRVNKDR